MARGSASTKSSLPSGQGASSSHFRLHQQLRHRLRPGRVARHERVHPRVSPSSAVPGTSSPPTPKRSAPLEGGRSPAGVERSMTTSRRSHGLPSEALLTAFGEPSHARALSPVHSGRFRPIFLRSPRQRCLAHGLLGSRYVPRARDGCFHRIQDSARGHGHGTGDVQRQPVVIDVPLGA